MHGFYVFSEREENSSERTGEICESVVNRTESSSYNSSSTTTATTTATSYNNCNNIVGSGKSNSGESNTVGKSSNNTVGSVFSHNTAPGCWENVLRFLFFATPSTASPFLFSAEIAVILLQAYGGIAVSLVIKYADSIIKAFATSLSIVITALISSFLFPDFQFSCGFLVGTTFVGLSVYLYAR